MWINICIHTHIYMYEYSFDTHACIFIYIYVGVFQCVTEGCVMDIPGTWAGRDVALCCSVMGCSVLLCVTVCCNALQCVAVCYSVDTLGSMCWARCCSVLHCAAMCCSALQCVVELAVKINLEHELGEKNITHKTTCLCEHTCKYTYIDINLHIYIDAHIITDLYTCTFDWSYIYVSWFDLSYFEYKFKCIYTRARNHTFEYMYFRFIIHICQQV